MWKSFRQYHYLSGKLGAGVLCYVAVYNERPVGFVAIVHTRMKANYFRVSRLVVLPDYQGIGIGKRLLNFVAELYTSQINLPFYLVTSNPQLIRGNLNRWKVKRFVVKEVAKYAPDCKLMIVTNPVDIMTFIARKESGLPPNHVFGMGNILD